MDCFPQLVKPEISYRRTNLIHIIDSAWFFGSVITLSWVICWFSYLKPVAKDSYSSIFPWFSHLFFLKKKMTTSSFFLSVVYQELLKLSCCCLLMLDSPCIPFNLQGSVPSSACSKSFSELFSDQSWTTLFARLSVSKWKIFHQYWVGTTSTLSNKSLWQFCSIV